MRKLNKHNRLDTGFKVPDDYFSTFEENLISEIELKEKVNTSGFKIPRNYMNDFEVKVPSVKSSSNESKVIALFSDQKWLVAASIAAIFILLVSIPTKQHSDLDFGSLDNDSIESYLLTNDFDSAELNHLITNPSDFETSILEKTLNDLPLEDYLYNNIELEDLNLE